MGKVILLGVGVALAFFFRHIIVKHDLINEVRDGFYGIVAKIQDRFSK